LNVLLQAASWHHVPAVAFPSDEWWIAMAAVLGVRLVRRQSAAAAQRDQVHGAKRRAPQWAAAAGGGDLRLIIRRSKPQSP
jgi:hypothetical protein